MVDIKFDKFGGGKRDKGRSMKFDLRCSVLSCKKGEFEIFESSDIFLHAWKKTIQLAWAGKVVNNRNLQFSSANGKTFRFWLTSSPSLLFLPLPPFFRYFFLSRSDNARTNFRRWKSPSHGIHPLPFVPLKVFSLSFSSICG